MGGRGGRKGRRKGLKGGGEGLGIGQRGSKARGGGTEPGGAQLWGTVPARGGGWRTAGNEGLPINPNFAVEERPEKGLEGGRFGGLEGGLEGGREGPSTMSAVFFRFLRLV